MKKNNSILITGGAGFIGSNIAKKLHKKGYKVRILDNLSPQIHGMDAHFSDELLNIADCIKGSVTSKNDWLKALDGIDAIIHLAAETGTGQSMYEIEHYSNVNIGGTALLMDILTNNKHSIKKVIVAASRAIYGEGMYRCLEHGIVYPNERTVDNMNNGDFECKCPKCNKTVELIPTTEDTLLHPTSIYGITKQVQEQLVMTTCKALNIPAISYRYQNVYGPGQSLSNPYTGILSIFSTRILSHKSINIFEDGEETRDFVFIDDVADATIAGLENDTIKYETFNVGSGIKTSVNEVVKELQAAYGINVETTISGNYRIGDIRHNFADISKLNNLLHFYPATDFKTGIKKFADWVKTQEIADDKYEQSLEEMKNKGLFN